jgi:transcriptional regulator with GAF, ATPase, and Fis domain
MNRARLPHVMVSVAQNQTLDAVLRAIVEGLAGCPDVALARIWLEGPGDVCESCRFRAECPDQTRCLHLVASAGNPRDGADLTRLDGAFRRFPIGVRKIGRTAQSGVPLLLPDLRGDEEWIADRAWLAASGVRTFAAQPLEFRGQVLGVLAIFDRGALSQEDFDWIRVLSDHAAVSIANARAFEEIATLKARLEAENSYLREEVISALGAGGLIGTSAGMTKVMQQIQLVAPTDAAVLITGESGTGKEMVARAIHEGSPRADRPFIKVNCSAVPETLFESEFFGHAKGAFTGALRDKPGRFELADGGTLLLDEIGEVPLAMQAKLLRVLQEQEVERVGESRVRRLNVRVLAATNRVLRDEVQAGRFRQDLFYRLSVFPIEIPPLRERTDDIPALAAQFVGQTARRLKQAPPRLSHAAIAQLVAHDWPGNVRELQHAVERAMILSRGGPVHFELARSTRPTSARTLTPDAPLTRAELKRKERESIEHALARASGKVFGPGGAAELLQMKPTTLASRMKALGIQRSKS